MDGNTSAPEAHEPRGGNALSATVYRLPVFVRRIVLIAWDALAWVLAMLAFLLVRYDFDLS
ncbi:MAG: hypothetical protein GX596_12300, partial [Propionibacterium sp.]|nr:hypothetical protein [Propionibacterium sp.]